jgi:cell fate (sporulation/competence/biofilm development) regulator YmcA (YheA/YmcA/DUF963 family)
MKTNEKIKKLQEEIKAMQTDPLLKNHYGEKVRELMKLRRQQIREGKKSNG